MKRTFVIVSILLNIILVVFGSVYFINKHTDKPDKKGFKTSFYKLRTSIYEDLPNDENEIVFLGNSLIDYGPWESSYDDKNVKNRGIAGDVIEGMIFRLKEVTESKPDKIFLMAGTNNLGRGDSPKMVISKYENLIKEIKSLSPGTQIYVHSLLPTFDRPERKIKDIIEINKMLGILASKYKCIYIDVYSIFQGKKDLFVDGLHINGKGYLLWKEQIDKHVY